MFRWGIIGLGRIAHKFAQELTQTSLGVVGAAASRDLAKAEDFTALYGGVPYGDYDDFISDASVDAVYVAVLTIYTSFWLQNALKKGFLFYVKNLLLSIFINLRLW